MSRLLWALTEADYHRSQSEVAAELMGSTTPLGGILGRVLGLHTSLASMPVIFSDTVQPGRLILLTDGHLLVNASLEALHEHRVRQMVREAGHRAAPDLYAYIGESRHG